MVLTVVVRERVGEVGLVFTGCLCVVLMMAGVVRFRFASMAQLQRPCVVLALSGNGKVHILKTGSRDSSTTKGIEV